MSLFTRSSIVVAIIFGCFAVLIPRVFLPFFRPRSSHHVDDHFRRPPPLMSHNDHDDIIEPILDSSPHMSSAHSDINNREQSLTDLSSSKPAITFALPMYTVGIGVFFIYTCFKYWTKRTSQENKIKLRYSSNNIQWNAQKSKFKYHTNHRHSEDEDDENEELLYAGLDADYVEYLKSKKQKEFEVEQGLTTEQRQMHHTLDEMKNSLSFITSKLGVNKTNSNLTNNEISQLQDRLASTEAQMYKILHALDAASNKMNAITQHTRESLEQPPQTSDHEEEEDHPSSRESEDSLNDDENSNSDDDDSFHQEEQKLFSNDKQEDEESSSSYEEDEEVPNKIEDDDDESESSSERYGIMNTNYECDPTIIDDYELDTIKKPDEKSDSRTKVQEWHQRNHSQSLSSSNSSIDQEQDRLSRRKSQE